MAAEDAAEVTTEEFEEDTGEGIVVTAEDAAELTTEVLDPDPSETTFGVGELTELFELAAALGGREVGVEAEEPLDAEVMTELALETFIAEETGKLDATGGKVIGLEERLKGETVDALALEGKGTAVNLVTFVIERLETSFCWV